jgi:hypothetical protein
MDYAAAFTFITRITEDKDWISKAIMAALFVLLMPILGLGSLLFMGWSIAVARHVINGEEAMPDWSELGQIVVDGLKAVVIFFIWSIPVLMLSGIAAVADTSVVSVCVGLIGFLYVFLLLLLMPAVLGLLASGAPFGTALNPGNSSRMLLAKLPETVIVAVITLICLSLASTIGLLLCGIGVLVTVPYAYGVVGNLYGQLYSEAQADLAPKAA